jgi:hypothetical protein
MTNEFAKNTEGLAMKTLQSFLLGFISCTVMMTVPGCGALKTVDCRTSATVCEIHSEPLREDTIKIMYGTPFFWKEYEQAKVDLFPLANYSTNGGCISSNQSPGRARVKYCPECRKAQGLWLDQHKYRSGQS